MSNLLLFFALPISIIILSIIFETSIKCPIKIAGITFSILLIATFSVVSDETFLIYTILYTILSYVVAWITKQWNTSQEDNNICLENLIENVNNESIQNTSSCRCNRR